MPWSLQPLLQARGPSSWAPKPALPLEDRGHILHSSYSPGKPQCPQTSQRNSNPQGCALGWERCQRSNIPLVYLAKQHQQLSCCHWVEVFGLSIACATLRYQAFLLLLLLSQAVASLPAPPSRPHKMLTFSKLAQALHGLNVISSWGFSSLSPA